MKAGIFLVLLFFSTLAESSSNSKGDSQKETPEKDSTKPDEIKFDPLSESAEEDIIIYQQLAMRSKEITARENALKIQTLTLKAAEESMNEKLKQFEILKKDLIQLLDKLKDKDEKQYLNLVKIYTSMKPKQAATILNTIDMSILKEIVKRMSQKKAAPILAAMDTKKAKELTQNLAKEGQRLS